MHKSLTKRRIAVMSALLITPLLLVGCAGGAEAPVAENRDLGTPVAGEVPEGALDGASISFAGSGGTIQDAQSEEWLMPFAEASGAEVLQDAFDSGKLKAMVDAGSTQWDIVHTSSLDSGRGCGTLYEKIDVDLIDTSKVPEGTILNECMIPSNVLGLVMVYNTEAFGDNPPEKAADFFDTEKFPGKRGISQSTWPSVGTLEFGLLAQGIESEDITAEDIPAGLAPFQELGANAVGWTTGAQAQQQLESGEVAMSLVWVGRAQAAAAAGASIAPVWNDWYVMIDAFAIAKGSKDVGASHAALNYYLGTEPQNGITELTAYGPVNVDATPQLEADTEQWLATNHLDSGISPDEQFWIDNYDSLTSTWATWVTGTD